MKFLVTYRRWLLIGIGVIVLIALLSALSGPDTETRTVTKEVAVPGPTVTKTEEVVVTRNVPKSCTEMLATLGKVQPILDSADRNLGVLEDDVQESLAGQIMSTTTTLNKLQGKLWHDRDAFSDDVSGYSVLYKQLTEDLSKCSHDVRSHK